MSFHISFGIGGPAGWNLLQRTAAKTKQVLARDPVVKREIDYYRDNIKKVETADDLVKDYRLLSVALKAHGLETEINFRGLIKKVLESDLNDPRSLANRLSDKRYLQLAESFNFNKKAAGGIDTSVPFEERVGLKGYSNKEYGFVFRQKDELAELANVSRSDFDFWDKAREDTSLKQVLRVALDLPDDFFKGGKVISYTDSAGNKQEFRTTGRRHVELKEVLKRFENVTGTKSLKDLARPEISEKLLRAFVFHNRDVIVLNKIDADTLAAKENDTPPLNTQQEYIRRVGLTGLDKETAKATEKLHKALTKIFEVKDRESTIAFSLLRKKELSEVVSNAFDLGKDFEKLSFLKKEERLVENARKIFGVGSLTDLKDPAKLDQIIRRHVFSLRTAEKPDPSAEAGDPVDNVAGAYLDREFESRIGQDDQSLQLALNAWREIKRLGESNASDKTKWFQLLGNPPLREVFQTTFGFGPHMARLNVDRQVNEFSNAANRVLGTDSFAEIAKEDKTELLVRTYLARAQLTESSGSGPYSAALALFSAPPQFF